MSSNQKPKVSFQTSSRDGPCTCGDCRRDREYKAKQEEQLASDRARRKELEDELRHVQDQRLKLREEEIKAKLDTMKQNIKTIESDLDKDRSQQQQQGSYKDSFYPSHNTQNRR